MSVRSSSSQAQLGQANKARAGHGAVRLVRRHKAPNSERPPIAVDHGLTISTSYLHSINTTLNLKRPNRFPLSTSTSTCRVSASSTDDLSLLSFSKSGVCRASQVADIFPAVSPEIVVREARLEDCWEVAETHCSSFFPDYAFPLDFVLRVDRLVGMLTGFSLPTGWKRTCLVAVIGNSVEETVLFGNEDFKIVGLDAKISLSKRYVAGILTVDTVADFLPRKGPLRQRRWHCTSQVFQFSLTPYVPLVAGSLARSLACVSCYPIELARTRMQVPDVVN